MNLSESVAFELHEQFRKSRLKEDGYYESKWESIKDTRFINKLEGKELPIYIRKVEDDNYEIDIANACYNQLSPDWKNESKEAAEVVLKIIKYGKELSKEEIGDIIHNAWLERNPLEKGGGLGVPFAKLPKTEQDKELVQYDIALLITKAIEENRYFNTLNEAIIFLDQAKRDGKNIVHKFNGHNLYSQFDTPNTCFLKVCRMTREELRIINEKRIKEFKERWI